MKQRVKNLLKAGGLYYPLQGFYSTLRLKFVAVKLKLQYRRYRGGGLTCNFCGAAYSRFAAWYPAAENKKALEENRVIAGYGKNILCPSCLSMARERLLKAILTEEYSIAHRRILHISPEKKLFDFLRQQAVVTTVDYYPQFYKKIDPAVQFADVTRLTFANDSFDMVIGNHIMEHIPEDFRAMTEIFRVLKPGGIAVLQVPFSASLPHTIEAPGINDPARQSALFGQHDHVRIYALHDYLERLRKAGFTVSYRSYSSLQPYYRYAIQEEEGFITITK